MFYLQLTKSFKLQVINGTLGTKKERFMTTKSLESTTQQFLKPLQCWLTLFVNQVFNTVNEITPNYILPLSASSLLHRAKTSPLTKPSAVFRIPLRYFLNDPRKLGTITSFIYVQRY